MLRSQNLSGCNQGKLGVQPTVPSFLHFSAARMISRLQSWLNTSSDPSRRALLATLHPTASPEEDLTNWVGSIVFLLRGISGRSGYSKTDKLQSAAALGTCCVVSASFLLKTGWWSWPTTVSEFVNWHLNSTVSQHWLV